MSGAAKMVLSTEGPNFGLALLEASLVDPDV